MALTKSSTILALTFLLVWCATLTPPRFNGPGTFQDFANAGYQSLQETTQTKQVILPKADVRVVPRLSARRHSPPHR